MKRRMLLRQIQGLGSRLQYFGAAGMQHPAADVLSL